MLKNYTRVTIAGILLAGALPAFAQFGDLLNKVKEAAEEASDSVTETAKQLIPSEKPEEKQETTVVATPGAAASNCPEPHRNPHTGSDYFPGCWRKQQDDYLAAEAVYKAKWDEEDQRAAEERAERERLAAEERKLAAEKRAEEDQRAAEERAERDRLAAEEKKLAAEKREEQREDERLAAEKRDPNCEEQRLAFTESASVSGLIDAESHAVAEFGAESGLWCEWSQSESVEQCTKNSEACFCSRQGCFTGIPFAAKGFSAQMSFENFVAKAESFGGKPITAPPILDKCDLDNFLGSDAKMNAAFLRIARDEDCRRTEVQILSPGHWASKEKKEITLQGFTVVDEQIKHRKKIAYSFEGEEFTLADLPVKYAYYNYVEITFPNKDRDEKEVQMERYVRIVMVGGETDVQELADALHSEFYPSESVGHKRWRLEEPRYKAFNPSVVFVADIQGTGGFVVLTFLQKEWYTRPPATSTVNPADL